MFDLFQRFSIHSPHVYMKSAFGDWIQVDNYSHYVVLKVEKDEESLEILAIDVFKALTVCPDHTSVEDAMPYAQRLKIRAN